MFVPFSLVNTDDPFRSLVYQEVCDICLLYFRNVHQIRHILFYTDESPGIFPGLFVSVHASVWKAMKKMEAFFG
jgi:hypothetical protein